MLGGAWVCTGVRHFLAPSPLSYCWPLMPKPEVVAAVRANLGPRGHWTYSPFSCITSPQGNCKTGSTLPSLVWALGNQPFPARQLDRVNVFYPLSSVSLRYPSGPAPWRSRAKWKPCCTLSIVILLTFDPTRAGTVFCPSVSLAINGVWYVPWVKITGTGFDPKIGLV